MFGGDSAQLAGNIMSTVTQVSDGLSNSLGIDLSSVFSGMLGGTMAAKKSNVTVNVEPNLGEENYNEI